MAVTVIGTRCGAPPRRKSDPLRQGAGFTLVELSVVLVVIAILAAIALNRLWPLQAQAERVALENMLGTLRSALGIKVASYIAKDDLRAISTLVGTNPMDLLTDPPANYLGVSAGGGTRVAAGEWYFDSSARVLAYRVRNGAAVVSGSDSPQELRFAITAVFDDRDGDGRFGRGDRFYGVRLEPQAPYRWQE